MKHRPRRLLVTLLAALALLAAGCAVIAQPEGWAAPVALPDGSLLTRVQSGQLAALDPATGAERWRFPAEAGKDGEGAFYATPLVEGSALYTVTFAGTVSRADLRAGGPPAPRWSVLLREPVVATPILQGDRLFVVTDEGQLHVIDVEAGTLIARHKVSDGRIWGQPAFSASTLYVSGLDRRNALAIGSDGTELWNHRLSGAVAADLLLHDGLLLVGSFDSAIHALDVAQDGRERWRFDGDGWFMGAPIVVGDTIFAATMRGSVYAIDLQGRERWRFNLPDAEFRSAPVLAGGTLVVADRHGTLVGLDASTGAQQWRQTVRDTKIDAHPVLLESGIFYVTNSHELLRVDPAQGNVTALSRAQAQANP